MRIARFRKLLDSHGCRLDQWPDRERRDALALLSHDPAARRAHQEAERLATLLDSYDPAPPGGEGARIMARLTALPRQRQDLVWWPALLSHWDFTPSWPRVVTLATMAALGLVIGLNEPDADGLWTDVSALVFDSGPGVGLGP